VSELGRELAEVEGKFTSSSGGNFKERFGPAGPGVPHSQKKLCLTAADAAFLIRVLYDLSIRSDCYYVKYSVRARDGMYLGRCFLLTDSAAAHLCRDLKSHPKLLVSLQDDEFFNDFRST